MESTVCSSRETWLFRVRLIYSTQSPFWNLVVMDSVWFSVGRVDLVLKAAILSFLISMYLRSLCVFLSSLMSLNKSWFFPLRIQMLLILALLAVRWYYRWFILYLLNTLLTLIVQESTSFIYCSSLCLNDVRNTLTKSSMGKERVYFTLYFQVIVCH